MRAPIIYASEEELRLAELATGAASTPWIEWCALTRLHHLSWTSEGAHWLMHRVRRERRKKCHHSLDQSA